MILSAGFVLVYGSSHTQGLHHTLLGRTGKQLPSTTVAY